VIELFDPEDQHLIMLGEPATVGRDHAASRGSEAAVPDWQDCLSSTEWADLVGTYLYRVRDWEAYQDWRFFTHLWQWGSAPLAAASAVSEGVGLREGLKDEINRRLYQLLGDTTPPETALATADAWTALDATLAENCSPQDKETWLGLKALAQYHAATLQRIVDDFRAAATEEKDRWLTDQADRMAQPPDGETVGVAFLLTTPSPVDVPALRRMHRAVGLAMPAPPVPDDFKRWNLDHWQSFGVYADYLAEEQGQDGLQEALKTIWDSQGKNDAAYQAAMEAAEHYLGFFGTAVDDCSRHRVKEPGPATDSPAAVQPAADRPTKKTTPVYWSNNFTSYYDGDPKDRRRSGEYRKAGERVPAPGDLVFSGDTWVEVTQERIDKAARRRTEDGQRAARDRADQTGATRAAASDSSPGRKREQVFWQSEEYSHYHAGDWQSGEWKPARDRRPRPKDTVYSAAVGAWVEVTKAMADAARKRITEPDCNALNAEALDRTDYGIAVEFVVLGDLLLLDPGGPRPGWEGAKRGSVTFQKQEGTRVKAFGRRFGAVDRATVTTRDGIELETVRKFLGPVYERKYGRKVRFEQSG